MWGGALHVIVTTRRHAKMQTQWGGWGGGSTSPSRHGDTPRCGRSGCVREVKNSRLPPSRYRCPRARARGRGRQQRCVRRPAHRWLCSCHHSSGRCTTLWQHLGVNKNKNGGIGDQVPRCTAHPVFDQSYPCPSKWRSYAGAERRGPGAQRRLAPQGTASPATRGYFPGLAL